MKLYICKHCGNIATKLSDHHVNLVCCNEEMEEMVPNTTEAAFEKHIPVIETIDDKKYAVVGSVLHPMTPEHYIEWMIVDYGDHQRIYHFNSGDTPRVKLCSKCEVVNIYAYCNLHGLWSYK